MSLRFFVVVSDFCTKWSKSKFKEERMTKKIVDLMSYKIEKELKENGFTLKRDGDRKVKLLIKLKNDGTNN
jgi:hypothetical protein